jgi:trigger factor
MTPDPTSPAEFEQLSPTQYKVKVVVPEERMQRKMNEAYFELSKHASIPGFRPGKAPKNILNRFFGKERIIKEMSEEIVEDTFWPVIKDKELTVVGQPTIEPSEWHEGEEFKYTATIEVLPVIPEIKYDEIKVVLPDRKITDEIIADEIHALQVRMGKLHKVDDRPVQDGDHATLTFEGSVPDVLVNAIEGDVPWSFKQDDLTMELGHGKAIPGLEDAIRGMELEEIKEFELTLPEDFDDFRVRGKILKAKVHLRAIRKVDLPELTDEFVKEKFGEQGIESVEALKKKMGEELESSFIKADDAETIDQIEAWFSKNYDFPLPTSLVKAEFANILDRVLNELKQKDIDIDELMEPENVKGINMRKRSWWQAERLTRINILLQETARREKIGISDEDVANYIMMLAYRQGLKEKDLKLLLGDPNFVSQTKDDILRKRTTSFLVKQVVAARVSEDEFKKLKDDSRKEAIESEQGIVEKMEDPIVVLQREHDAMHHHDHDHEHDHDHDHDHDHEHDHDHDPKPELGVETGLNEPEGKDDSSEN